MQNNGIVSGTQVMQTLNHHLHINQSPAFDLAMTCLFAYDTGIEYKEIYSQMSSTSGLLKG